MISPQAFVEALRARGVHFFTGVPDSLLSGFCAYIEDTAAEREHLIAANEGNAIAIAIGRYLTTGSPSLVYMQNSGLGNAVNPLASLADPEVYRIPMLLLIGWRGEPGLYDEPQHVKQGRITVEQLRLLGLPLFELGATSDAAELVGRALDQLLTTSAPVALLVHQGAFSKYKSAKQRLPLSTLTREEALDVILASLSERDLVISTTGKASRELFELRARRAQPQRDFLTVGGMGHTSSIALGAALGSPSHRVVCLDGDGSMLMHLGAIPVIGAAGTKNLLHVLLNNGAHESVGGQPTVADRTDFGAISRAAGYTSYARADSVESLLLELRNLTDQPGPILLEVRLKLGSRDDLGRPTSTPEQNKNSFMRHALATRGD